MNTENNMTSQRLKDQTIEWMLTDTNTGKETGKRLFLDIRGGISWPTPYAPAYFCIVGQEIGKGDEQGKRILLAEEEDKSLFIDTFYAKLIDTAERMGCSKFYAALPEDRRDCGYLNDFYQVRKRSNVMILEASDANDFLLGVNRIRPGIYKGELVLPANSLVHDQLSGLVAQDLEDKPEQRYHAINGLRHVLGTFFRHPPAKRKEYRIPPPPNWRCV